MLAFRIGQHTFALMGFFINRCIRCAYKWTLWTGNDLFLINNKTILCYLYLLHMTLRVLWVSNTGHICKLKSNLPILLSVNTRYEGHYTGSKLRSVNLPPDMMLLGIGDRFLDSRYFCTLIAEYIVLLWLPHICKICNKFRCLHTKTQNQVMKQPLWISNQS